jgi:hypothetical protein
VNKNTVNASIEFHYQGELYSAAATIDLDQLMEKQSAIPSLHDLLAKAANIGPYTYQYEMLEAEDIVFSDAQGLAANFLHDGQFDVAGFENAWRENKTLAQLQSIAERLLGVDDFTKNPELKKALLEAYLLGKKDAR